ncbi:MAG: hypothetical protein HY644_08870 [Acidobacteria bacterium]|nr:hypothetical protein [Acidobacteriota bacterium]
MSDLQEAILEEQKKIRRLRFLVDLTSSILYQDSNLTLSQAIQLVRNTEMAILRMFPDKQATYDLILKPRFERILNERWPLEPTGSVN